MFVSKKALAFPINVGFEGFFLKNFLKEGLGGAKGIVVYRRLELVISALSIDAAACLLIELLILLLGKLEV